MKNLTFDEFEYIIGGIKKEVEFQDKVYDAFANLSGEYYRDTPTIFSTITLLNKIFEDDSELPLIDYWVYDLEFGDKWKEGCVTENGVSIKLQTVSDLYDALIKQKTEKEAK